MNLDDLIKNVPSVNSESMDAFAEWLYEVGEVAKQYHDSALSDLVRHSNFFIGSEQEKIECKAKILPRLKAIRRGSNYMSDKPAVFVVHGHDDALKSEVARFLERLGFEAVILHEQASRGKTIIEKLSSEIDRVKFGIVLYTADDTTDSGVKRARQNVVFEHGFLVGRLGRDRVCVIMDEGIEKPSDNDGIVYIPRQSWKYDVANELIAAGFSVDKNLI